MVVVVPWSTTQISSLPLSSETKAIFSELGDQAGRGRDPGVSTDAISASIMRSFFESSIDPRKVIKLSGIGETFSGNYRLKSTTHSIDTGGYKVNFQGYQEIIAETLMI